MLIANVLPILTGFWLALYFTDASIFEYWDVFLFTMIGGTLVIAGALALNNWYEVDLDREMERTKKRPTVTGNWLDGHYTRLSYCPYYGGTYRVYLANATYIRNRYKKI